MSLANLLTQGWEPNPYRVDSTQQTYYIAPDGNDSNNGLSPGLAKLTVAACQAAAPAGPLTVYARGNLPAQTITVDRDGLTIDGGSKYSTTFNHTGAGAFIANSAPATIRRGLVLRGFTVYGGLASAGARGLENENFYRPIVEDVWLNYLGVNASGLKLVGGAARSTYFGVYRDLDITSAGICQEIGDNCNGHTFYGGVLDGPGSAIIASPALMVSGENKWFSTSIQTTGLNTATIGGGGQLVNTHEFHSLRVETGVAGVFTLAQGSAKTCGFYGGSFSGCTVTYDAGDGHSLLIPQTALFQSPPLMAPQTMDARLAGFGASALVANQGVYMRVTKGSGRISKLRVQIGAQSGNICVAVFANNGLQNEAARPGARKATSGSIACPAVGTQDIALGAAVSVVEGDWFYIAADNAVATFQRGVAGITSGLGGGITGFVNAEFPAPANASALNVSADFGVFMVGIA